MTIQDALEGVSRLFLDTSPFIYFVENSVDYFPIVEIVFKQIDQGILQSVTSPITLAESLIIPYRNNNLGLQKEFNEFIVYSENTIFAGIDAHVARSASDIRARYNLKLPDAFQVAIALENDCDALLTNDTTFKRVTELNVLLIDDFVGTHAS